jgi:hypothetical protein
VAAWDVSIFLPSKYAVTVMFFSFNLLMKMTTVSGFYLNLALRGKMFNPA